MRRTMLALGCVLVAVSACSSNAVTPPVTTSPSTAPSIPAPVTSDTSEPPTVDERLHAALLTPATLSRVRLDPTNAGSHFDETENTKYAFVTGCGPAGPRDRRIDDAWQGTFGTDGGGVHGEQLAVHYPAGAAAALAEIRARRSCAGTVDGLGNPMSLITAPKATGVAVRCLEARATGLTTCQLVAADGDIALAVTLNDFARATVLAAARTLAPLVRLAATGRQPSGASTPPATSSAPPAPTTGTWTTAVARERFTTMLTDREVADTNRSVRAALRHATDDTVDGLTYLDESAANDDRIVAANLGVGRWPSSVAALIATVRAALDDERTAYARAARTGTVALFRAAHERALRAVARTETAIAKVARALG